jgi:hypothetical protein
MILARILPTLFALFTTPALAAAPSGGEWFTLSTKNFRVHHTAPLEIYSRHVAFTLERSLPLLEARLKWRAPTPLDIVVMDTSDSANGLAANFPNTRIELYAVPFEQDSPLSHYLDWVDELAIHELTHIIANDSAQGYYLTLRSIFGSWVKPNGLQPSWLIEGLAVYQETALSSAGRGRSPWLEAMLREAVREGKLNSREYTSLDRFNDGNEWWPGGSAPYFLGYAIQALGERERANFAGEVSFANSGYIPFMPNKSAEELLGRDWASIWAGATERLQSRYAGDPPLPSPCFLTTSGRQTGGHALSPDGWVYFTEESFENGFHLARVRADAPCDNVEIERLHHNEESGASQVSVSEDGSRVAFSALDHPTFERRFSDLYLWHRDSGKTKRLTRGERAREPAFVGEHLFYVQQKSNSVQAIRRLNLSTGENIEIFAALPLERIGGIHGRGNQILFSRHDNRGQEKILSLSTSGGPVQVLVPETALRAHERNPYLAADGRVWFSRLHSLRSGLQVISVFDPAKKTATAVLSLPSGFADRPIPLPDGKNILLQAYGLRGMDLARASIPEELPPLPIYEEDLHQFLTGEEPAIAAPPLSADLAAVGSVEPYRATSTPATSLWPQYWLPEISAAEEGALIGASTSGNDPLEHHHYGLLAQFDTRAKFPRYRAFYRNRSTRTNFFVQLNQYNNYFASTGASNRTASYSAEANVPIGKAFFTFGGAFQEQNLFGRQGQSVVAFQDLRYTEMGKKPAALETNFGQSLRAYVGLYPNTKNEKIFVDVRPTAALYFSGFRPSHAISATAKGGITTNRLLVSNYYLGGGVSVLKSADFVVRGYPVDSLLGQRITTLNLAYSFPLAHPFRGWGTNPLFLRSYGLRLMADAGTSNFVSVYQGNTFTRYLPSPLGKRVLTGLGVDFIANGSSFYHIPLSLVAGVHYGTRREFGGGVVYFLGLNAGLFGNIARDETH